MTTADNARRALEILGLTRGTDHLDMTRAALDAYSSTFEASDKQQRHHEQALLAAIVAAAPYLLDAAFGAIAADRDKVAATEAKRLALLVEQDYGDASRMDAAARSSENKAFAESLRAHAAKLRTALAALGIAGGVR